MKRKKLNDRYKMQKDTRISCNATQCIHRYIDTPYCNAANITLKYDNKTRKVFCTTYKSTNILEKILIFEKAAYYIIKKLNCKKPIYTTPHERRK